MILSLIMLFVGVALITLVIKNEKKCPVPKVEYRFVPRTFKEEQESPIKASEIFEGMFEKPTPFLDRTSGRKITKNNINRNFISQG